MSNNEVKVTIGLPVYNGADFLEETIDSLLSQTYEQFELIISDNASTDGTEQICRLYVNQDPRVKYVRNGENLGAAKNYNQLVDMAEGEYFKWAAADDICLPSYIERCVKVLDADAEVVLCYTQAAGIDENGEVFRDYDNFIDAEVDEPWKRFYAAACRRHNMTAVMVFGLIRTAVLRRTHMIGAFSSSDRVLVGELGLYGRFHMIPEVLFLKRDHPQAHWIQYNTRQARMAWYDTSNSDGRTYPHWRLLQEHLISIKNAPVEGTDRLKSYAMIAPWVRYNWRFLMMNMVQKDEVNDLTTNN
ncbi:MAG: glycosyltransferase family 2 protein [Candidatus Promineifilaceae bacterium]|jgi:glycosyltransferase involved in cell wall biosynthesis